MNLWEWINVILGIAGFFSFFGILFYLISYGWYLARGRAERKLKKEEMNRDE